MLRRNARTDARYAGVQPPKLNLKSPSENFSSVHTYIELERSLTRPAALHQSVHEDNHTMSSLSPPEFGNMVRGSLSRHSTTGHNIVLAHQDNDIFSARRGSNRQTSHHPHLHRGPPPSRHLTPLPPIMATSRNLSSVLHAGSSTPFSASPP